MSISDRWTDRLTDVKTIYPPQIPFARSIKVPLEPQNDQARDKMRLSLNQLE